MDGDVAARYTIPATPRELTEWVLWVDGHSLVPDEKRAEDEPPAADAHEDQSEEYTPLEFVRLLDDFIFMPLTIGKSLKMHPLITVLMIPAALVTYGLGVAAAIYLP